MFLIVVTSDEHGNTVCKKPAYQIISPKQENEMVERLKDKFPKSIIIKGEKKFFLQQPFQMGLSEEDFEDPLTIADA